MLAKLFNSMSFADSSGGIRTTSPDGLLKGTGTFWFSMVMLGQWLFFYYIIAFYGFSVITGNLEIWNRFEPLGSKPYVPGDTGGNLAFAAHTLGAGIVAFGGALQLIPGIRARFPRFHKINGYVYLTTVVGLALSGYYLVLIRGTSPDLLSAIGTCINGAFILFFAYKTVQCARNKDIASHRKWAMRLFLVSNAQWFLRVGVFSYLITGNLLGLKPGFGDLFFPFWTFGCYLVPLVTLQLYFYASEHKSQALKYVTGLGVLVLTLLMIIGVAGYTPFLQALIMGETISI